MTQPTPRDAQVRKRMRRQSSRDTGPELAIRRSLHAQGYRFRVDHRPEPDLRCRGDIVFTRKKVVIFVDGCFWHGCPDHATQPKHNRGWWAAKLAANVERDRRADEALRSRGWVVVRVWEHQTVSRAVAEIVSALDGAA